MSLASFWNPGRFTRKFGEYGKGYTIVKDRHIGLDVKGTADIPCLVAGTVNAIAHTPLMGPCVEIDTGRVDGRYWTYCHIAKDDLPTRGEYIEQGERVGRPALGPKDLPSWHVEFPGTSWGGTHVHLVISDIPGAAWTYPPARKLSDFYDPEPLVRSILASPASLNPRPIGDDFMSALSDTQQAQVYDSQIVHGPTGDYYKTDVIIGDVRTFGNGLVARANATNTRLVALEAMIAALDPDQETDMAAIRAEFQASEARTIESTRKIIADSTTALQGALEASISNALGLPAEQFKEAIDEALGSVFKNYQPDAAS